MSDDFLKKRFADLANQSDRTARFTFTDFLTEGEYAEFCTLSSHLTAVGCTVFGGYEDAERVMIRFGSEEYLGYSEAFPIQCVHISPLQEKFGENLSHRDILGAVMHLGIERSSVGDIVVCGKNAYVFCKSELTEYICRELIRIRHTTVRCTITETLPDTAEPKREERSIQVASERIDGVIAKVFHISRGTCAELFRTGKVFVDGMLMENHSRLLKGGEKISVRGYGKFLYVEISGQTRKGNLIAHVEVFV
ncbi:MAG: YlmH/Sll1252 family protein [Oscillospiraceae bacterium]|nr:YlmH/Sll1252 family protein [Oscillospiraceae bacterium]